MATASPPASSSSSSPGSPPPRHHQEQQQQPWQEPEPGSPGCSQLLAAPAPGTRCSRGHRELRELHCRGTPDSPGKSCGAARKLPGMDVLCACRVFACECCLRVSRLAPSSSRAMTIPGEHVFRLMFPISAMLSLSVSSTQIHKE